MTTPRRLGEFERIEVLRRIFGAPPKEVSVGIGDDAAILLGDLAWSIDEAVEGTHFRFSTLTPAQIGFRATMAALSDLAAMGATPLGVLSAVVMPPSADEEVLFGIAEGQRRAADVSGTAIIGGNLARGLVLSITTSVLGRGARLLTRSGASAGDRLWLAGSVGLAHCGFLGSEKARAVTPDALAAFSEPRALIEEGRAATAARATAMIDVSDGLLADVEHLARASGVRCVIDPGAFIRPELIAAASLLELDPLTCALYGGEDYALVAAAPSNVSLPGFQLIGHCLAHVGGSAYVELPEGLPLPGGVSFDHFR